jgi:mono/diheme cytochrome c family protein
VFVQTCATCHGFQAQGLPHNGAALRTSPFIAGQSDKNLISFIRAGRRAKDPTNKSGVAMPPSGNNPSLSDARLADVVAYLRQVQEEQKAEATAESTPATSQAK